MRQMLFSAAFHDAMKSAVPHIIERLEDNDSDVRSAAVNTCGKLAERGR
jgi:HEAT repeat protein